MALIQKTQFKDYVDFSDNISDKKLNYHIKDAELFDFVPLVPIELFDNLNALINTNIQQWSRTTAYIVGDKSYSPVNQKAYTCISSSTNNEPSANPLKWEEIELYTLFEDYIKPYLICSAYVRVLLWAGRNMSQYGLRTSVEDTSSEISDKARGELMADINNKKSYYWSRLIKTMSDNAYTYDDVVYNFNNNCEVSTNKRTFHIRAV